MRFKRISYSFAVICSFFGLSLFLLSDFAISADFTFTDDAGKKITLKERSPRVVSLVPSVTEAVNALGAGERIKGKTYHSSPNSRNCSQEIVGGFYHSSLEKIANVDPEMIFVSENHKRVRKHFASKRPEVITFSTGTLRDSFRDIRLLGRIFAKEERSSEIVKGIKEKFSLIEKKVERIPREKKKRVIRFMGRDAVMTPGRDSFQNQLIRRAGGIPPDPDKKGQIVPFSKQEWQEFNPQVIYGCGDDKKAAKRLLSRSGWREVEAMQEKRFLEFPCDLTCRAGTHSGDFVSWLSSRLYAKEFARKKNLVLEEGIVNRRALDLDLSCVSSAQIVESRVYDFLNKTLKLELSKPMRVVSTLQGEDNNIKYVGNHYTPPPGWSITHNKGLEKSRAHILKVLDLPMEKSSFLFTGANMDNLAVKKREYKELRVNALVTAGVQSNAVRMSRDTGRYYEPGTINIILISNMRLSPRAMTRAIVSATEAKTAALSDMDIRSSYSPSENQSTGTGTDNVLVVEGTGTLLDNAGGHSKLGELMAKAVYAGVQQAVWKQNKLSGVRNIFQRLQERDIDLYDLFSGIDSASMDTAELYQKVEGLLLDSRYAGFMQTALAVSRDYQNNLISDLSAFRNQCLEVAGSIAGKNLAVLDNKLENRNIPRVEKMALNALINGVIKK